MGMSPSMALMATKGVLRSTLDIDAARRIGVPLWSQNAATQVIKGLSGGDMDSIDRFAGVAGSYLSGIGKISSQEMTAGEKAVQFAPIAFKNLYEGAIGYNQRGAVNWKGKTLVAPEELTINEMATKAIGFTPSKVAAAREKKVAEGGESRRGSLGLDRAKDEMANIQAKIISCPYRS